MNIQTRKVSLKRIRVDGNCGICELAKKLHILLDAESIRKIVESGMKSTCSEEQLAQTVKELEERKKQFKSDFQKIARQLNALESKYVGMRKEINRVFTDNRIQVFHLSARSLNSKRERLLRDELIRKYIGYSKLM